MKNIYEESSAADSNCKNLAASHQTPLFALLGWSRFTGGQHALCRLPSRDLYLKCINNLREVRCDTPDSPSRRNTTVHFFLLLMNLFIFIKLAESDWSKEKTRRGNVKMGFLLGGKLKAPPAEGEHCILLEHIDNLKWQTFLFASQLWDLTCLECSTVCFWTMGGKSYRNRDPGNRTQPKVLRYQC